mgnify:CR=1 FL=1
MQSVPSSAPPPGSTRASSAGTATTMFSKKGIGILPPRLFRAYWRHAIVVMFVAAALLTAARDWIRDQGMAVMRGPGCFTSNHDWYGLQVGGKFNRPVIGMPYNPRYYEKQLEDFGLTGAKDLYAWDIQT